MVSSPCTAMYAAFFAFQGLRCRSHSPPYRVLIR